MKQNPAYAKQLKCTSCGIVIPWFHGWSFTVGKETECLGPESKLITGKHHWKVLEGEVKK